MEDLLKINGRKSVLDILHLFIHVLSHEMKYSFYEDVCRFYNQYPGTKDFDDEEEVSKN